jgi:hypothetical protein
LLALDDDLRQRLMLALDIFKILLVLPACSSILPDQLTAESSTRPGAEARGWSILLQAFSRPGGTGFSAYTPENMRPAVG